MLQGRHVAGGSAYADCEVAELAEKASAGRRAGHADTNNMQHEGNSAWYSPSFQCPWIPCHSGDMLLPIVALALADIGYGCLLW